MEPQKPLAGQPSIPLSILFHDSAEQDGECHGSTNGLGTEVDAHQ